MMGNALVCGLIKTIGKEIKRIGKKRINPLFFIIVLSFFGQILLG